MERGCGPDFGSNLEEAQPTRKKAEYCQNFAHPACALLERGCGRFGGDNSMSRSIPMMFNEAEKTRPERQPGILEQYEQQQLSRDEKRRLDPMNYVRGVLAIATALSYFWFEFPMVVTFLLGLACVLTMVWPVRR
jgi:hypothetical protein